MICIKSPFRVSFFGGGSDFPEWFNLNGGSVLTSTINQSIYLFIRENREYKYTFRYSNLEQTNSLSLIKHPAFRNFIKYFKIKNIDLTFISDLPSFSGLGSSSALSVSLIHYYLSNYKNRKISKNLIAEKSIYFEREILKEKVGYQDQVAITFGGINKITFNNNSFNCKKIHLPQNTINKLNSNFFLLDSGIKRFSNVVQKDLVKSFEKSKKNNFHLKDMTEYVDLGKRKLLSGSVDDFGKMFDEYWYLKKKSNPSSVSNNINYIYDLAKDHGAYGGKLLGAGSGGFFLFYVPNKNKKNFLELSKKFKIHKYELNNKGTEIIKI